MCLIRWANICLKLLALKWTRVWAKDKIICKRTACYLLRSICAHKICLRFFFYRNFNSFACSVVRSLSTLSRMTTCLFRHPLYLIQFRVMVISLLLSCNILQFEIVIKSRRGLSAHISTKRQICWSYRRTCKHVFVCVVYSQALGMSSVYQHGAIFIAVDERKK